METRASYVLIGSFALGIVVLAVVSVLWLGSMSLDREWDRYDVVFDEPVSGLGQRGAVEYNGIQVGEVRRLSLDPEDPRRVIARVRIEAGTPIKTDTRARLALTGVTGVSVIQLSGGTPEAPRLRPERGEEVPVIVAESSTLQSLLTSGEGLAANADRLLQQLGSLLRDENIEALSATFANLESVSASVIAYGDDIDRALTDLAEVSRNLNEMLKRADRLITTLDRDVPELVAETEATLTAARTASERLGTLLEENRGAIGRFTHQGLGELGPAVRELRATLVPLRALAERLEADPGLLLQPTRPPSEHAPP